MRKIGILMTPENRAKCRAVPLLKTQTRRVIKRQPGNVGGCYHRPDGLFIWTHLPVGIGCGVGLPFKSHYAVGDHLYLKEPYQIDSELGNGWMLGKYLDDKKEFEMELNAAEWNKWAERRKPWMKTSSLFMYKSLARKWFLVNRVWVERVQDISVEDCHAEGGPYGDARDWTWFCMLWNEINEKKGYGWDVNPWVFCYEFEIIKEKL